MRRRKGATQAAKRDARLQRKQKMRMEVWSHKLHKHYRSDIFWHS